RLRSVAEVMAEFGAESIQAAGAYNNLGLIFTASDPKKAALNYRLALDLYRNEYPDTHPTVAGVLGNLGEVYVQQEDFFGAETYLMQALDLRKQRYGDKHPSVAFAYAALARLHAQEGKLEEAIQETQKALEIYQAQYPDGEHPNLTESYNLLATLELENDAFEEAEQSLKRALAANANFSLDLKLTSYELLAETFAAKHARKTLKVRDLKTALSYYQKADSIIVKIRHSRSDNADKLNLGARADAIYDAASILCLRLSEVTLQKSEYEALAFSFAEKNKAGVLVAAIAEAEAKQFVGLPDSVLTQEQALKATLAELEQRIAAGELELRDRQLVEQLKYEEFIVQLETEYPEYYVLKFDVGLASLEDLQAELEEDELLLSYQIIEEEKRLLIFEIQKSGLSVQDHLLNEELRGKITQFRNALFYRADDAYHASAYDLRKALLPKRIRAKHIYIIPEGELNGLAFGALLTENTDTEQSYTELPYLAKEVAIGYAYSTTLWLQTERHQEDTENIEALTLAPIDQFGGKAVALPSTADEVQKVFELFDEMAYRPTMLSRAQAQKRSLLNLNLADFRFLHFATHGEIDENAPANSRLVLANGESLFVGEIYNLQLNAELVVLSACETGLGKNSKGEGLIGFTRALTYAGAENIVVSLWSVADDSTAELMKAFTEIYLQNPEQPYAVSLQQAQEQLMRSEAFAEPFYWAAFVVVGE
ncbi:MAG: CHAT domain-containing tetratricopeptide repeat protein, partial [Bacteroidota bacterium]